MPMAMIAPMNDCTLSVVPVASSITQHTAEYSGHGQDDGERQADRLEVCRQQKKDDQDGKQQADPQARQMVCSSGGISPRSFTLTPFGGAPTPASARFSSCAACPERQCREYWR